MAKPVLETDPNNKLGGVVLTSKGDGWARPTGVFLPDKEMLLDRWITVILWFHGYYIQNIASLFYKEETRLLPAVINSGRNVVLVAPHLGYFQNSSNTSYNSQVLAGGGKLEAYLDQVLGAMGYWYLSTLEGIEPDSVEPPKFQVAELYVAGHSGGGGAIMSAAAALGGYRETLRECWGFDCLYGSGQGWYEWARAQGGMPLYFYYGQGTQPGYKGDVIGLWKLAYGTLKRPLPLGGRMLNMHLAPALPGTEMDMVAFQFIEDIMARARPGNRYEEVRRKVDPLLESPGSYWWTLIKEGLFDHYPVVSELLGPRIRQSIL